MRIQHNIMAMNAYRNYNNNTSALSSNLEKLSSGYKINRAGDDAAGLAISEKMRAQISGLEQASSNVKDGISLVKTGEGALQEVQDMLNRMVTLATQSANGTYDDETDRAQLQKEVDSLTAEINRIADSSNFNGINLLDGSLTEAATVAEPTALDNIVYDSLSNEDIQDLMLPEAAAGQTAAVGTNTLLETSSSASVPSFTVSFDGVKYGTVDGTETLKLTFGTDTATTAAIGGAAGDVLDSKDIAALFNDVQATIDSIAYTAKDNGDGTVTFTADSNPATDTIPKYTVSFSTSSSSTTNHLTSTYSYTSAAFTVGTATNTQGAADDASLTVNAKSADGNTSYEFKLENIEDGTAGADIATALAEVTDSTDNSVKLGDLFDVTFDATNHFVLTAKEAGTAGATVDGDITFSPDSGTPTGGALASLATTGSTVVKGIDEYTDGVNGYVHYGSDNDVTTTAAQPDQLASTTLDLTKVLTNVADGTKIRLGEETYTFAVGNNSLFAGEAGAITITEDEAKNVDLVASKLTQAAANNETFSVGHVGGGSITLKQLSSAKDSTDMTTMEAFAKNIEVETVNTTASADALAKAQSEAADAAAAEAKKSPLMLQIGDTSESYNQLSVTIEDMHAEALGIDQISIKDQQSASDAINVIKNAINQVSSTRGTLGATQNRLEHTANNLSVMTENIQDAESTIRDTDIAEEMMSYTKNSILVQSAQAMLAQANTVPQGVLQLLQ